MAKRHNIEELLAVGDQLFRKQGYYNTGTDEILKAADYPRSSFYHHFSSKEQFAVRTIEYYGENLATYISSFLDDGRVKSHLQRLRNYFMTIIQHIEDEDLSSMCVVQRFAVETAKEEGPLQRICLREFDKWIDLMEDCLRKAQEQGEVKKDQEPRQLARFIFAIIYGEATLTRLTRDANQFRATLNLAFNLISI